MERAERAGGRKKTLRRLLFCDKIDKLVWGEIHTGRTNKHIC